MAKRIEGTTPKQDGFRMPGEFEPQKQVWMLWPERPDVWRSGAKPAQKSYVDIATTISQFTPVTVCATKTQFQNARNMLPKHIRVIEMSADDAWIRDTGPTFVVNDKGDVRGVDWEFNAYGGFYDGLYFPWDQDDLIAQKVCEIEGVDSYRAHEFVLEGGSIHVDGEGTLLSTEMCLLSPGRNPHLTKEEIEEKLTEYLNLEKIIWIKDGIDPDETTGHVDDVACFARPGEVICIWEENPESPFYQPSRDAYEFLCNQTDAKGRKLKVHKLCMPKKSVAIGADFDIDYVEGSLPREEGDLCISSYLNFLITNDGVIVPQYGDENDALAVQQLQEIFPDKKAVGVSSREVVYGGGNIHCITQQQPLGKAK